MAQPTMEERLGRFWIFEGFSQDELAEIAKFVEEKTYYASAILFTQGDVPKFFYLVEDGMVEEIGRDLSGKIVLRRRAESGDFVGRYSLMENTHRRATATVRLDSRLLAIKGSEFKAILATFPILQDRLRRTDTVNRLLATPLFDCFTKEQLLHVADLARKVEYPAGQTIFRQDEPSNAFYVIDTGQVKESRIGDIAEGQVWPKYLTAGNFFGRHDLLENTRRRATAEAVTDVQLFRFNAGAFNWLCKLQPRFRQALTRPDLLGHLQNTNLFAKLSREELKLLAGYVGLAHYPAGERVYSQGEIDPTLYILYEGEAVLRARDEQGRERPYGYLKPGDAVGETSLLLQDPRDATVVPVVDTNWFYLTHLDLAQFLAQQPGVQDKLVRKSEVKTRQQLKRFPWMYADEQFVLRERRHWFFVTNRLIPPAILALLAAILFLARVPNFFVIGLLVIAFPWMLWRFIDWTNDYYIVTTKRVAHRDKVLAMRERRDETPLDKIQNVNIETGFFGNIFGFGTLIIDTAAAAGVSRVTFDYLGEPDQVQALIFEQMSRLQAGERSEAKRAIRDKLEQGIGVSIRPVVPQPAVPTPATEVPTLELSESPGILAQVYETLFGSIFWIEKRVKDQVVWRKHWIRLLRRIWMPGLALLFLLLILAFGLTLQVKPAWLITAWALGFVLTLLWFWWNWENWGNDRYIVTNDRIIDIEALPLGFRTRRTETTFDRIQNVSFEIPHPVATLLNYGTVVIFTAGAEGRLDFDYVRDPKGVQAEIFHRLTDYEVRQRLQQREQQWADLPQWFATYEEMRSP